MIVAEAKAGIVTVLVVSWLNCKRVWPLNCEYSRGIPAEAELQANLMLTPNFNWKVEAVPAATKQSPFACTKVKVVAVAPIFRTSPIWYPTGTDAEAAYHSKRTYS